MHKTDMQAAYKAQAEGCGIEVGDTVKVVREFAGDKHLAISGHEGWTNYGKPKDVCVVCMIDEDGDFKVTQTGPASILPWYCLELVKKGKEQIKIGEHTVEFTDDGIKVGCQTVTKEEVDKIHGRMHDES